MLALKIVSNKRSDDTRIDTVSRMQKMYSVQTTMMNVKLNGFSYARVYGLNLELVRVGMRRV